MRREAETFFTHLLGLGTHYLVSNISAAFWSERGTAPKQTRLFRLLAISGVGDDKLNIFRVLNILVFSSSVVVLDGPVLRLAKNKNALLRRATYQVFVSVLKIPSDVITAAGLAKVAKLVMGLFGEREASNHGALWNLFLRFSRRYPVRMRVGSTMRARCYVSLSFL